MYMDFKYKFSDNSIKFKLLEDKQEIWMENVYIDYEHPKIFFMLLKSAIEKFIELEYKFFVQTVLKEEWNEIKHLNWTIYNDNPLNPYLIIKCDINDALENIVYGLGF